MSTSSMEKMLINATQLEEVRVALILDNLLYDLDVECPNAAKKKGNIYKATVTRREPSLDAVFVEYGAKRQGFLPLKEISSEYFVTPQNEDEKKPVTALIKEGQELLIQVDKEERGSKGAALTTFISLAGSYLVLMPNSPNAGGISRRIEGDEREELKQALQSLNIDPCMGVIIRTAGLGKSQDELQSDLDMLVNQWQAILNANDKELAPSLIHQEGDVVIRAIRDNLKKTINEIIIDDAPTYVKAKQYIEKIKPEFLPHLKLYKNPIPLFNLYQLESQIETAHQREVILPSGGALVIDKTEALVSIDINSAKSTSGSDIETTAFQTNLEAAEEIARQLRLRDLGGLIVIDFIDMSQSKNQRDVEAKLKDVLKADRARIQVGRISRFGLLEMSRQRIRLSLGETAQDICPRCDGKGFVRHIQSQGLSITRLIEEEALKSPEIVEVQVQLPVEMATYLMNEKRNAIQEIEQRQNIYVIIVANPYFQAPQFQISHIRSSHASSGGAKPSYTLLQPPQVDIVRDKPLPAADEPAVKGFQHSTHGLNPEDANLLKRLWRSIFGSQQDEPEKVQDKPISQKKKQTSSDQNRRSTHSKNQDNNNRGQNRKHHKSHQNKGQNTKPQGKKTNQNKQQSNRNKKSTTTKQHSTQDS